MRSLSAKVEGSWGGVMGKLFVRHLGTLYLAALALGVGLPLVVHAQVVPEAPVRYDPDHLPAAFHRGRRQAVLDKLPPNAVAVFFSAPTRNRSNDVDFLYHQDSDLFYLSGTHEPGSVLVLAPGGIDVDGRSVREVLFVPPRNPSEEVWDGRRFGAERAQRDLGVALALDYTRFAGVVGPLVANPDKRLFHLPLPGGVEEDTPLGGQIEVLRPAAATADGQTLRMVMDELRTTKTAEEMVPLRRAIDITVEAHREAMRSLTAGMREYEIQALIEYVFARNGAPYPGFPSIVGSGENTVILHYESNRRPIAAGDLVLMDIGAEVHGYTADITRTIPANGTFSPEQKAIYEIVLRAQEAGIQAAKAGAQFGAPHQAAARVLAAGLAELGLISGPTDANGLRRFFMHGTSHYLGLDVHDVGAYGPLTAGTVITVEPGIYIAPATDIDRKWWNIGVRIEDDVLITAGDPMVLSARAPREVAEIEALMRETGLGNQPGGKLPLPGR
jgi:Xaa-Pro aminopeptidase